MKTVEITIRVEVPDEAKWVAVDELGNCFGYPNKPLREHQMGCGQWMSNEVSCVAMIANWKDTLTEVK